MAEYHVVGAGGIGCVIAYALATARQSVVLVEVNEDKVRRGNQGGLRVNDWEPRRVSFTRFAEWEPQIDRTVFLCTKCFDNQSVLQRVSERTTLIPIQNGFDPALAARSHTWEGIASFVSECPIDVPHPHITRRGALHFGPRKDAEHPVPSAIAAAFAVSRLFRFQLVPDVIPYKYAKLMYNAAIGPLAAVSGLTNGQLLVVPKARKLFFELLRENYAILAGAGIKLGKIGPLHPRIVRRILDRPAIANALAWAFYPTLRGSYCSMSGDLPRGRTEIDYYNLRLIELAGDRPCPLNRSIHALVKRLEKRRAHPSLQALDELNQERRLISSA